MSSPAPSLAAPWRIGVDVGGTFTDMVLRDDQGAVHIFKAPSVPADPSEGVLGVLRLAAQQLDLPLSALLRDCALFVHGSTVATNTILEKKGARVGLLTTEGFRDSLEIRRGMRENQWDHRAPFPEVLAPRYLRLPVRGRLAADGSEAAPFEPADVEAAAKVFEAEGAVSVDQVAARPVMLVLSGPAAGVGALKGCSGAGEAANFISMEIGGTSCDVMVMAKGEVPVADELVIDGYHLTTPSVEIHTVG